MVLLFLFLLASELTFEVVEVEVFSERVLTMVDDFVDSILDV